MTKAELEKEAKEFVSEIASGTPQEMDYYANILVEFANETTKELEKENAELKEKLAEYKKKFIYKGWSTLCYKDKYDTCLRENTGLKIHNAYVEKKLAEVKYMLNEFMRISKAGDEDFEHDYSELIEEAEKFIKEVK